MPKINAFVARSFDREDEQKIKPILDFLQSFTASGFIAKSADKADVESVSKKVRDMIDASDVFVGIFTRRYPIYEKDLHKQKFIFPVLGSLKIKGWTAPSWVIQESGYALSAKSAERAIFFRENGVELPALQADLEYVVFAENDFLGALQKASEMINTLLAKASGTSVDIVVSSAPPEAEPPAEITPAQQDQSAAKLPTGIDYLTQMAKDIAAKNWEGARTAYESGLSQSKKSKNPKADIFWHAIYHRLRYCAGQEDGLDALHSLAEEHPTDPEPIAAIAKCFDHFKEYVKAAEYHVQAAAKAADAEAPIYLTPAAKALQNADQPARAINLLLDKSREGISDTRMKKELYALLRKNNASYEAFAIGESVIQTDPALRDFRFSLAYDYEADDYHELSLFHYCVLRENEPDDQAVLNNTGVSYSTLGLPALSVDSYSEAYKRGNTLAANNLARAYLKEGFMSDARSLIEEALQKQNPEPQLERTLASISETWKEEEEREKSVMEVAEKHRKFLVTFGEAYLQNRPNLDGRWKLPEVQMALAATGDKLNGEKEETFNIEPSPLSGIFGTTRQSGQGKKKFSFSGRLSGRTCKFRLSIERSPAEILSAFSILGGAQAGPSKAEGYIVFSDDGNSGEVCELKGKMPSQFYRIDRIS